MKIARIDDPSLAGPTRPIPSATSEFRTSSGFGTVLPFATVGPAIRPRLVLPGGV
ncbi:MAG: hypothetical protein WA793_12725 [Sphingorhabdus sp.]|uniref:hypothetical protein n=1 Tax=Sphingorhabdus sp. TaxID=1902408 RepID=UPI003C8D7627